MWNIVGQIVSAASGLAIGWLMPIMDKIAYIYILHPEAQISQYLKYQVEKKQLKKVWQTIKLRGEEFDKLTTRGLLFQITWAVLAIFTLTSTAGWFGKCLVMGLGLRILIGEWTEWLKNKEAMEKKLLWQVKSDWTEKEIKVYLWIKTAVFIWLIRMLF